MRTHIVRFFLFWVGILTLSLFTADGNIPLLHRLFITAVAALIATLLFAGKIRGQESLPKSSANRHLELHYPASYKILYRIENRKIYKGLDVAPIYEIKNSKIYPIGSSKFVYRIESNRIYRGLEIAPIYEIKRNRICKPHSNKSIYEIKEVK